MTEEQLRKIQAEHLEHDMQNKEKSLELKYYTLGVAILAAIAAGFVKVWELALETIKVSSGQ